MFEKTPFAFCRPCGLIISDWLGFAVAKRLIGELLNISLQEDRLTRILSARKSRMLKKLATWRQFIRK